MLQDYDIANLRDSSNGQDMHSFLNFKKNSKSSRRENIMSLSHQMHQFSMQNGGIHKSRSYRMELTNSNSKGIQAYG